MGESTCCCLELGGVAGLCQAAECDTKAQALAGFASSEPCEHIRACLQASGEISAEAEAITELCEHPGYTVSKTHRSKNAQRGLTSLADIVLFWLNDRVRPIILEHDRHVLHNNGNVQIIWNGTPSLD